VFCFLENEKNRKKNEKKVQKSLHNLIFVLNLHSLSKTTVAKQKSIGLWCNGNTTVFGAVFQGSSPCRPTESLSFLRGFFYLVQSLKKLFLNRMLSLKAR
jgi:hypothetical protein